MLEGVDSYRTGDIQADPRFRGWWPRGHPDMRSFLGVPIVRGGEVIGAFYLTDKEDAAEFSDGRPGADRAAGRARRDRGHERAPVRAQPRALDPRRAQPAGARAARRDLAEAVRARRSRPSRPATLLDVDLEAAREQIDRLRQLSQEALEELRYLILELRPPELERDGLATTLRKHVEVLRRVQSGGREIELELDGVPPAETSRDRELLRIAQEALQNAIRHSGATRIVLRLGTADGRLVLEVADDGNGFDPQAPRRARRGGSG